jgi:hypothetical protein
MRYETKVNVKTGEVERIELPPLPVTVDDVKREAERRILAIIPAWRQRNLTEHRLSLWIKGRDNWTPEELAAWEAGAALWSQVEVIRAASDVIEAMNPIPQDYRDDKYWTAT